MENKPKCNACGGFRITPEEPNGELLCSDCWSMNISQPMTPTEKKAREICERFINVECLQDFEGMDYELSKQCALICVDEIIKTYHSPMDDEQIEEWQEVKNHIEKL